MAVDTPIRVGIIGLGRAGWGMHCKELAGRDAWRIVAGCDVRPERAQRAADELGAQAYVDYEDLLDDADVDVVVVATRSDTHAEIVIEALEAGKHVIAEKPFATSTAEADEIIAASVRAKGRLIVRHNRRFDPDFRHVREIVTSGKLGALRLVRLYRHNYQRRADWQTLRSFAGGQLNNWGPHIIDHALRLINAPIVDLWSDLQVVAAAGDAEDHLKIVLRGANGVIADIEISGGVALPLPVYHLVGDQGALTCDGKTIKLKWFDRSKMQPIQADPGDPDIEGGFSNQEPIDWQTEELSVDPSDKRDFYDEVERALTEERPFPVSLDEARAVVEVTEWAREGTAF